MAVFKKNGNWWIDCYVNGRRVRRKVGPTKRMAQLAEKDLKVREAKGEWLGIVQTKPITFKAFYKQKFTPRLQGAANTKKNYKVAFRKHFKPTFGKLYLHKIKAEHIEDYKAQRAQKARPSTINQELTLLGAILERAVKWKYLRENPVRQVDKLRVPESEINTLTTSEANQLLSVVPKTDWLYTFLVLALNTGMRVGEILALTWDDIDFKSGTVAVLNDDDHVTKTTKIRYMPMNGILLTVLKRHPRHISNPLLFASKRPERQGEAIHRNSIEDRLNAAVTDAEIDGHYRIHDLRHTFGTRLADLGENPRTIMELMGHSSIEMTMRYIHTSEEKKRQAVARLGFGGQDPASEGTKKAISARA